MPKLKSLFQKKVNKKSSIKQKKNIIEIFIQNLNTKQQNRKNNDNLLYNCSQKRIENYKQILDQKIINIDELKKLSWNGVPSQYRSRIWKLLLNYSSTNIQNQQNLLNTKRSDYFNIVSLYIQNPTVQLSQHQKSTQRLIHKDVIRTLPQSQLFRDEKIQKILQRILLVWHMRHPSSGYVQGLNDIVTPFIIVFLNDYVKIDLQKIKINQNQLSITQENLKKVQADSYWCFSKLMNQILDNYMNSWPGIQKSYVKIKNIIQRIDPELATHFKHKGIDFYNIYFKWVSCLLLRQFSTKIGLRLFDTFFSITGNFFVFCQYLITAIFLKFSKKLKMMNFEQLMSFQQKVPTKKWNEEQLSIIIAQAYVYQVCFQKWQK